ncbi:MFS transporter [Metallosphaera tengchongensis]|uniref:MFS transporter n=1 Tax=Metallosphaera tengchongensis TaxID=1532350 RepID=A0A6N0NWW9_9CREN|nr:MFS transporter [Metallosphaera tengchongensis]QKR00717.1 MFS transporter [Metallosphaera tengchongensis]
MDHINKVALIGGFRAFSGSIIWPFIGFALYKVYGFPLTLVSLFYLVQGVISVIASISGGVITDYLGRKRSMTISISFSSLALLLAYVLNLPIYVMAFTLVQTFLNTVYNVSSTTIVGDLYKGTGDLVKAYSRQRVGINAGWALGPLIGGYVFNFYGFRVLLLVSSLVVLTIIPLVRLLPDFRGSSGLTDFKLSKEFITFLVPTFLTFVIVGQLGFPLLTYYNSVLHFTEFEVGALFTINGVLIVAMQDLIGKFIEGRLRLITLGAAMYGLAYLCVALVSDLLTAALDVVFITLAEMIVTPISQALASTLADPGSRGKQMGVYSMVTGLGRVAGSSISSELMSYYLYSPLDLWGVISLFGFSSALSYFLVLRRLKLR